MSLVTLNRMRSLNASYRSRIPPESTGYLSADHREWRELCAKNKQNSLNLIFPIRDGLSLNWYIKASNAFFKSSK